MNTTETLTTPFTFTPTPGVNYHYVMEINQEQIQFYINDVLYGLLNVPSGNGQPFLAGAQPVCINHYITNNGAAGNICQMKFTSYSVSLQTGKQQNHGIIKCQVWVYLVIFYLKVMLSVRIETPVYPAYNAVVATTVPTTTTVTATGLGGRTQFALVVSENNAERLLFSYQNPAASAIITG